MSREIKFRGYCEKDSEWRDGYYVADGKTHEILTKLPTGEMYGSVVDPDSVGQYTGLKDKNGVEIYESDVVRCNNGHVGLVEWEQHDCCFNVSDYYCSSNDYPTMGFIEGQPFEVIGNIYETPELLENK